MLQIYKKCCLGKGFENTRKCNDTIIVMILIIVLCNDTNIHIFNSKYNEKFFLISSKMYKINVYPTLDQNSKL